MRPARATMLTLVAAAAVLDAHVAAAAASESSPALFIASAEAEAASLVGTALDRSGRAFADLRSWLAESYARTPALMLGLSVVMVVPALALAGLLVRRKPRSHSPETTVAVARSGARAQPPLLKTEGFSWPTEAWVDIDGAPGGRFVIGRTLVRIGREADNDIRLSAKTVHRYHAVIRRTTDGDVVVTDLSGDDGNGVLINGAHVAEARLRKGDVIHIGEVRMRFDARPV